MTSTTTSRVSRTRTWRTVDIVVAAVLAVAFGVVFQAWGVLWTAIDPVLFTFKPLGGVMVGVWLMAGVVGALVIRKPGAAIFVELVAATVEALLGSQWGASTLVYGLVQGLAVEIVFAAFGYRRWGVGFAAAAGALVGVAAAVLDFAYYYGTWSAGWKSTYVVLTLVSGLVVAGLGGWWLVRLLARTGVLAPFASGREQRAA